MINYACGAIIGALVGDAVGATLEFLGRQPTDEEVEQALSMAGGGVFGLAPGQVTDDGELSLALLQALVGENSYPALPVAKNYRLWFLSEPFDIGYATTSALEEGPVDSPLLLDIIQRNAALHNSASKANGSLMRISPLGVWASRVSIEDAVDAARQDASLTHPNLSCQWAAAAYVVAIRHLMLNRGDHMGSIETAKRMLASEKQCQFDSQTADGAEEVEHWMDDAIEGNLPALHPQAGYVRIAFTHAFYHLYRATPYVESIRSTLRGGGDTDTNACIVGGLTGALHGIDAIPGEMLSAVLQCDVRQGRIRPTWLRTQQLSTHLSKLMGVI